MYSSMCLILLVVIAIAVCVPSVLHMWCYSCMHHVRFFPPAVLFTHVIFEVFSLGGRFGVGCLQNLGKTDTSLLRTLL